MRYRWFRLFSVPLLLTLSATIVLIAQTPPGSDGANHVVIISLDGFMASAMFDESVPLPTLRRLAAQGAIARGMRPVNPTVTWANHTSMVTGVTPAKHGVIFNGLLVRAPGVPPHVEPWRDRRGIWNAPTVTWEFRERPDPQGAIAREMIGAGLVSQEVVDNFAEKNIVFRDHVWTAAAAHIIREHRPHLMMFHLLTLDSVQHRYGPGTLAATSAMAHLDGQVAQIALAVEQAGLAARTTFVIVSDHGFKTVRRQIMPNAAFLKAGLLDVTDGKVTSARVYLMSEGGTALVYPTVPDADGQLLARAREALTGIEGIDTIIEPADYASYGLPSPAASDQMGAFLLSAKDGYSFSTAAAGEVAADASEGGLGAHGYLSSHPELQALFIASGRGIKAGVTLDSVQTIDLAPTMAQLLGLELRDVDGRVLTEILTGQ